MSSDTSAEWLAQATVDPAVWRQWPDYRALLVVAEGLVGGPTDEHSDGLLSAAETSVVSLLDGAAPESLPEIAVWRAAFLAFGVKPRVARSSVEALVRRCATGLPRIDRLTDIYNAISVQYLLPLGGEDLGGYAGPARLVLADGTEDFETTADGSDTVDHPEPGEVVWRDDAGVTCRRWNWRQCTRTRLTTQTTRALFILDGLGEDAADRLAAAADALVRQLHACSPDAQVDMRLLER